MSFLNVEFPTCIAMGAVGGPGWYTDVSSNQGGWESRNQVWSYSKQTYDISTAVRTVDDYRLVLGHFNEMRGRLNSFPFKDFLDFEVEDGDGVAVYYAPGVYQLAKRYGTLNPYLRKITRPVDAAVNIGTLDPDTGQVTVTADQTRSVTSHAVGATHQFTLASSFSPNVIAGDTVYASGVTGSAADELNGIPLEVTAVAGADVSVLVTTTGLTASGGTLAIYPAADEITWTGEFRVPVRYGVDRLPGQVVNSNGTSLFVQAASISLAEVRE